MSMTALPLLFALVLALACIGSGFVFGIAYALRDTWKGNKSAHQRILVSVPAAAHADFGD